jgi:hypothetical protein
MSCFKAEKLDIRHLGRLGARDILPWVRLGAFESKLSSDTSDIA